MSDDEPRRSRTAWPGPMSVAGVDPGHEHELPAALVQRIRLLTRAVVIFGVCLLAIGTLLVLIILERGAERDREQDELKREIRDSWCTALDTLPEGGYSLDRLRGQYECGPGKPIADLPPEEQREIANRTVPPADGPVVTLPPEQLPPREGPGPRDFPMPNELEPEPAPVPEPVPSPPPLVNLPPVIDPVCDLAGVCLKE